MDALKKKFGSIEAKERITQGENLVRPAVICAMELFQNGTGREAPTNRSPTSIRCNLSVLKIAKVIEQKHKIHTLKIFGYGCPAQRLRQQLGHPRLLSECLGLSSSFTSCSRFFAHADPARQW